MNTRKLAILEEVMQSFLNNEEVCDGEDGFVSDTLHIEMARAASAAFDASCSIEQWLKDQGHMTA